MNRTSNSKQRGVGLIEVMVAALIFAVGIAALISLQGTFFKGSSSAQARTVAATLAEEKLEDLRGFKTYSDADADVFDFVAIGTNAGGQCDAADDNACVLALASTGGSKSIALGNISYSRDWTVVNYFYDAITGNLTTTATGNGNIAHKAVTINVLWTDTDNSDQSLSVTGIINQQSGATGGLLVSNTGGSGESPQVPYTPSTDDRVTPIQVGAQSKRETLVPSAMSMSDGTVNWSDTLFQAYTYDSSNILIRQEEFKNVACICRFDGTSTSESEETREASYPKWNTDPDAYVAVNTYVDVTGDVVTGKVKGCVDGGGSGCDANPNTFCEICCRDHHDKSTSPRKYDPYRSSDDYTGGNHKHYNSSGMAVTSGEYLEACRLKRIDGYWRVYQDWQQVAFQVLPLSDLTNDSTKATYAAYVNDVIDEHLDESKVAGETLASPPSLPANLEHTTSGNYIVLNVGERAELSARGVYLDYMSPTHLAAVQAKMAAGEDYLLHVPFYEIDITNMADWSSAVPAAVRVGPYDGPGNTNDLVQGELHGLATNATPVVITGQIKESNSGIVSLNYPIDTGAATNPDTDTASDPVDVCIGCNMPLGCTFNGNPVADGASVTAYQSSSVVAPAICTSETRTCTNGTLTGTYQYASCGVDCTAPWGGTVTNGSSVTAYLAVSDSVACTPETRTCTNGTLSGSHQYQACNVVAGNDCTAPWGANVANGSSITAWQAASVTGGSCVSESRHCTAGTLDGSFTHQNCTVQCALPWGGTIASGGSVTAWQASSVTSPATCVSETRTCDVVGNLSGSYGFQSCSVTAPVTCNTTVTGSANANTDSITAASSEGDSVTCTVQTNKSYSCLPLTTATNATITVTSAGSCSLVKTLTTICGSQTVNFKVTGGVCN